jgi:biopolymer transport protein ExbD
MPQMVAEVQPPKVRFRRRLRLRVGMLYGIPSLVDVIFLLLIFIMIGSSLVFQPGIQVDPPETSLQFSGVAHKLVITMTRERLVFFNDQNLPPTDWEGELDSRIEEVAKSSSPESRPVIIVKADRDVPYNEIVKIMSITLKHKLKVFLVTKTVEQ